MTTHMLSELSGQNVIAASMAFLQAGTLIEQLQEAEARVRAQPRDAGLRWGLCQLMCVMGQWTRAIEQLRVFAQLRPEATRVAQMYRELIRAERWRAKVLVGRAQPGSLTELPRWAQMLVEATRLSAEGQGDAADEVRQAALDLAPLVAGQGTQTTFDWISDSDSRLGPVCELVTAGHYRWLPISEIRAWQIKHPETVLDLLWAPCTVMCADGQSVSGFMPARYPDAGGLSELDPDADALWLGHKTVWREAGPTAIVASGRKTWATSAGDFGLFELADCVFGTGAVDGVVEAHDVDAT